MARSVSSTERGGRESRNITPLLQFSAREDFQYRQPNASPVAAQNGRGGESFLTNSQQFVDQAVMRYPQQFKVTNAEATVKCLPPSKWRDTKFRGRKVLFLLPSQALGNNVCALLFMHAFHEAFKPRAIGVFCARSTADIYLSTGLAKVYTLWIAQKDLRQWDLVIDLGHPESRRTIEFWPVEMETELTDLFGISPSQQFQTSARPLERSRPLKFGIFPIASSPLRTLPANAIAAVANRLTQFGETIIYLNRHQRQGQIVRDRIAGKLPPAATIRDDFASIAEVMAEISAVDYGVFADSGPAHMSKLYATPGVAVYSSAPGDVLVGRFRNLKLWTVPWRGPFCAAPCGLAKVRQTADGRIGCMGSLGVQAEDLPTTPKGQNSSAVEKLMAEPVPCIAHMDETADSLADFVEADVRKRLSSF